MSATDQPAVLACIDGSSATEAVCDYASWIASKVDAPLKLLHTIEHSANPAVADFSGAIGLGSQQELLEELTTLEQARNQLLIRKGQLMLNAAKERIQHSGVEVNETFQRHGSVAESLIDLEESIRVLVVGIRGADHESEEGGIGTQLENMIRSIHKPILVINKEFRPPKKILLAFDGSDTCRKALTMVATSPAFKQIQCHVVRVGSGGESLLTEAVQELEAAGIETLAQIIDGKSDEVLSQYQLDNDIDLMAMGAFSHGSVRKFLLGSFTLKMLRASQRPLLLLR